jgi:stage II sporulation protein D
LSMNFLNIIKSNKTKKYLILVFFIPLAIFLTCTPSTKYLLEKHKSFGIDRTNIRILLKKSDARVSISSESRMKIVESKTGSVLYDGKGKEMYFMPEQVAGTILIESWESPLVVDNEPYRGSIELHNILGKIHVINVLKIHEYLYGVVPCEIISSWGIEALKAQAVAARTYTYHNLLSKPKSIFDLDATTNFQLYKGISVEKESTNRAVDETSGKIAVYNGKPVIAFFHSTCGGRTSDDKYVWNGDGQEYLKSVKCDFCKDSPYYNWEEKISLYDIRECLKSKYGSVGEITGISFQRKDTRVVSAIIRHKNGIIKLSGNELRLLLPEKKIKSMFFTAEKIKDGLVLNGHGWGHGVGMCQWGARGMAGQGAGYKEILKYYYKGISIVEPGQNDYAGR